MTETDPNAAMNAWIRLARGYTPAEDEEPADEDKSARPGDANGGVRTLASPQPDMNEEIRAAVSRSRYGVDGKQSKPIPR